MEKEDQSKEDNSKYANIRRKAEEEAQKQIEKAKKEAYEQGLQQGKVQSYIGKQNPYTGKTIEDDYDVEQLADKIKGIIQQDAMYRNVNVINRLR